MTRIDFFLIGIDFFLIGVALALLAGIIARVISWRAVASFLIVLFMLTFTAVVVLTVYKFAGAA